MRTAYTSADYLISENIGMSRFYCSPAFRSQCSFLISFHPGYIAPDLALDGTVSAGLLQVDDNLKKDHLTAVESGRGSSGIRKLPTDLPEAQVYRATDAPEGQRWQAQASDGTLRVLFLLDG
jgi:hypothetical protein